VLWNREKALLIESFAIGLELAVPDTALAAEL